jgi:hypothetical protein
MLFQNTNETADLVLVNFVTIGAFIYKGRSESNSSAQVSRASGVTRSDACTTLFAVPWTSIYRGVHFVIDSGLRCILFKTDDSLSTASKRNTQPAIIKF